MSNVSVSEILEQSKSLAQNTENTGDLTELYGPIAKDVLSVNAPEPIGPDSLSSLGKIVTISADPAIYFGLVVFGVFLIWLVIRAANEGRTFDDYFSKKQLYISFICLFLLVQTNIGYVAGQVAQIKLTTTTSLFADKLASVIGATKPNPPEFPPELVIGARAAVENTLNSLVCSRELVRWTGLEDVGTLKELDANHWVIPIEFGGLSENGESCGRITWYPQNTTAATSAQEQIKSATRKLIADLTPVANMLVEPASKSQAAKENVDRVRAITDDYVRALAKAAIESVDTSAVESKVTTWRDLGGVYQQAAKMQSSVHAFASRALTAMSFAPPTAQFALFSRQMAEDQAKMLQTSLSFAMAQELLTKSFAEPVEVTPNQIRKPMELNLSQFCTTIPPSCDTTAMEKHVSEWLRDNLLGPEVQEVTKDKDALTRIAMMGLRKRDTANALLGSAAALRLASAIPVAGEVIEPVAAKLEGWADTLHSAAAVEVDILPIVPVMLLALINQYYLSASAFGTFIVPFILVAAAIGWLGAASRGLAFIVHTMLIPVLTVISVAVSMPVLEISFRFATASFWGASAVESSDGSVYSTLAFTVAFFLMVALTTWKSFQIISNGAQQMFTWLDPSVSGVSAHAQTEDPRHATHQMPSVSGAGGSMKGAGAAAISGAKQGVKGGKAAISKIRGGMA